MKESPPWIKAVTTEDQLSKVAKHAKLLRDNGFTAWTQEAEDFLRQNMTG
jgi:hypothetical protein